MSYFYNDNYMVKETKKAFLVSELFQEDLKTVRIKKSEVEETLKKLDISNMTPMEAMNQLYELQKKCK